tara:strand:- start:2021 stop:2785 length:765 start_codon:yes stop_codon:yes gene_type:complete
MQIVIRKSLLIAILALLLVTFVLTLVLAGWVWRHLGAELALRDQIAQVAITQALPIDVQLQEGLELLVDGTVDTTVPVKQVLTVPLQETLDVSVDFDGAVDVNLDVPFQTMVKVDEMMPLEAVLDVKIMGVWTKLPIRGVLPIRLNVPVNTVVPVRQSLPLSFTKPVQVALDQQISVPLDTRIRTSVPLHSVLQVPQPPPIKALATVLEPAETTLTRLDLALPMNDVGFSWKGQPVAGPAAELAGVVRDTKASN